MRLLPEFSVQMGDSGKESKRYGHDCPLFAWETIDFMPVDNVNLIIHGFSAFLLFLFSCSTSFYNEPNEKTL